MTGIAIAQPRSNAALVLAAMLLVGAGLVLGFALAQVSTSSNIGVQAAEQQPPAALSANEAYQAQRAGERAGTVPLSRDAAFQAQRAGERAAGTIEGSGRTYPQGGH